MTVNTYNGQQRTKRTMANREQSEQWPTENKANNGRQYTTQTIKDLKKERSLV